MNEDSKHLHVSPFRPMAESDIAKPTEWLRLLFL